MSSSSNILGGGDQTVQTSPASTETAYYCDIAGCEADAYHSLCDGEYHYCDEHYEGHIVGECAKCGTEIHDSWDWTAMMCGDFCRPCAKKHHDEECAECFPQEDEEEEEVYDCEGCGVKLSLNDLNALPQDVGVIEDHPHCEECLRK
jgi:hypothetical protein